MIGGWLGWRIFAFFIARRARFAGCKITIAIANAVVVALGFAAPTPGASDR